MAISRRFSPASESTADLQFLVEPLEKRQLLTAAPFSLSDAGIEWTESVSANSSILFSNEPANDAFSGGPGDDVLRGSNSSDSLIGELVTMYCEAGAAMTSSRAASETMSSGVGAAMTGLRSALATTEPLVAGAMTPLST